MLPDTLLLYFVLRGLPDKPYGPTNHIILATPKLTLLLGFQLLKDVGEGHSDLITATLGSGQPNTFNPVAPEDALNTSTADVLVLTPATTPPQTPPQPANKAGQERQKNSTMQKVRTM